MSQSKPPSSHLHSRSRASRSRPARLALAPLIISAALAVSSPARASDQYEYDATGRLFKVTHHTGQITTYTYDGNGNVVSVTASLGISGVEEAESSPLRFALGRAYPNPGQSAAFTFSLPKAAPVTVRLFSITGRLVATILNGTFDPGTHRVELSRGRWAAGVYYYRLDTPGFSKVRKFVLLM